MINLFLAILLVLVAASAAQFNTLHHLGANSPWFPGTMEIYSTEQGSKV